MALVRRHDIPPFAWVLVAAIALVAAGVGAGHGRATIPAFLLISLLVARVAARIVTRWDRVVIAVLLADILIPEDGRYTLSAGFFQFEPYRVVVGFSLIIWLASLLANPRMRVQRTGFEGPLGAIVFVALTSDLINPGRVSAVMSGLIKGYTLFFCLLFFLYLVVSVIRSRAMVDRFVAVVVSAGCVEAIGAVYQRETNFNIFDHLHRILPMFQFNLAAELNNLVRDGSLRAVASAGHPIELSNTMAILIPLAAYLAIRRRQPVWWAAMVLLLVGEFASGSKTGILELVAILLTVLWLRPRETLKCWPALIPILLIVQLLMPGVIGGAIRGFFPQGGLIAEQTATYQGKGGRIDGTRLSRIGPGIRNEFLTHNPLFGEGFGTRVVGRTSLTPGPISPVALQNHSQVLDDQWFGTLLETGILGLLSWLWLFVRVVRKLGARAKLERGSPDGWLPVALAAAIAGYGVAMSTYDALGFIQATFLLYMFIAFAAVILRLPAERPVSAASPAHVRPALTASSFRTAPPPAVT